MAAVDVADLIRTLKNTLGAEEDIQRRHVFYKIRVDGQVVRTTMLSHGLRGAIGQPLLGQIARQLGLNTRQLEDLVAGRLTAADYFGIIAE